jgi:hypothetical protein
MMAKGTTPKTPSKPAANVAKAKKATSLPTKPKNAAAAPAKPKATTKPKTTVAPQQQKISKSKAAKPKVAKGVIKQTTEAISQLASDILADRIVPTVDQIKAVAASALGQDQTKGSRAKKKK